MTTAQQQSRYRASDYKRLVQVRLMPETLARLDRLAKAMGAAGRGEVIDRLIVARDPKNPLRLAAEGLRLIRAYFDATGEQRVTAGADLEALDHRPPRAKGPTWG